MSDLVDKLAKKIWNYMLLHQQLEKTDLIIVFGSHDLRVAEYAADLYLQGLAPLILFSGKSGDLTENIWDKTEADKFAEVALSKGVNPEHILREIESTNSGENILFSKKLLEDKGIKPKKMLFVQKPYMERRLYASLKKQWPNIEFIISSPPISYEDYPFGDISREDMINVMVGDLQRIKEYPKLGYQIPQEVPEDIWDAYDRLIELGFDKRLIKN